MAGAFNLTAQVNAQLSKASVAQMQGQLGSALKGVKLSIPVEVSDSGAAGISALKNQAAGLQGTLGNLTPALQAAAKSAQAMAASLAGAAPGSAAAAAALGGFTVQVKQAVSMADSFDRSMKAVITRLAGFASPMSAVLAFGGALRHSLGEAVSFERELVRLSQVAGDTEVQVQKIGEKVTAVATAWGVSSREMLKAAVSFRQAGMSIEDTGQALDTLAKAALSPNFGNLAETTRGMISIFRQFGAAGEDLERQLGAINAVSSQFAVTSKGILKAVEQAGGAFKTAGGSLNELIALFTAVKSTTQEADSNIASGLRTIVTRLERGTTIESLRQLGVQLRYTREEAKALGDTRLADQFVGPYEAVKRLGEALKDLQSTDPRFTGIVEMLGGYRQVSRVIPLLQQQEQAQKALNVATFGGATLQQSASRAQDTLLQKSRQLGEEFLKLGRTVVESKGFQGFATSMLDIAKAATQLTQAITPLVPVLTTLASIKLGQLIGGGLRGAAGAGRSLLGFATGGVVPGQGNQDSVPAVLTPGEFVIKQSSARKIGYDRLHEMNHYADGGDVPALLALRQNAKVHSREDVQVLRLKSGYQAAARRYINQRMAYLESDRPPLFSSGQRATLEGVLFEHYIAKHLSGFNPGKGLDFPGLGEEDRKSLARITGADVSRVSGVELKRTASSSNLSATLRKAGYASGGVVTPENIKKIVAEFEEQTGIKFGKLIRGVRLVDTLNARVRMLTAVLTADSSMVPSFMATSRVRLVGW
jgi:TP901 family phage tail tape measure protein